MNDTSDDQNKQQNQDDFVPMSEEGGKGGEAHPPPTGPMQGNPGSDIGKVEPINPNDDKSGVGRMSTENLSPMDTNETEKPSDNLKRFET